MWWTWVKLIDPLCIERGFRAHSLLLPSLGLNYYFRRSVNCQFVRVYQLSCVYVYIDLHLNLVANPNNRFFSLVVVVVGLLKVKNIVFILKCQCVNKLYQNVYVTMRLETTEYRNKIINTFDFCLWNACLVQWNNRSNIISSVRGSLRVFCLNLIGVFEGGGRPWQMIPILIHSLCLWANQTVSFVPLSSTPWMKVTFRRMKLKILLYRYKSLLFIKISLPPKAKANIPEKLNDFQIRQVVQVASRASVTHSNRSTTTIYSITTIYLFRFCCCH